MRTCQVVPDIPSFAVDDGFAYLIPEPMDVSVGSRVRVRVSGRRLKGWVTAIVSPPPERKLLPLDGLSGNIPSFSPSTLHVARRVATHYVSPLSTVLRRTLPPNVATGELPPERAGRSAPPRRRVIVSSSATHVEHIIDTVSEAFGRGASVIVIAPTIEEVDLIVSALDDDTRTPVVSATSSTSPREATAAWVTAATAPPCVLVGTREIALWPVAHLDAIVVVEDARRVMKSPSTPTLSVRDVAAMRSDVENVDLDILSPVPTLESLRLVDAFTAPQKRLWPLVEVADRSEEAPPSGIILDRTKSAIRQTVGGGGKAFVLVPRRGYAPAFRCVRCRELRRCQVCGTAATRETTCRRCGATLDACASCGGRRFEALGAGIGSVRDALERSTPGMTGTSGSDAPIVVGSERDIVGQSPVDLAIAVDVDGMTMAPTYRSAEDALRLLVRTAHLVRRGRGGRLLAQTADPRQPVIETLRSGRLGAFLDDQARVRRRLTFPPYGELIALEIDRTVAADAEVQRALGGLATVLGPAPMDDRDRWLIRGADLTAARTALRSLVGSLRDRGARVRVDVDPIDL